MKNKLFRRVSTTALSLVFIVSMVLGTLPAFAADTDKTNFARARYIESANIVTNPVVTNVVKGKTPVIFEYTNTNTSTTQTFLSDANIANLTDESANTDVDTAGYTFTKDGNYCADGSITVKLAFCLDAETYIENIQVVSSKLNKDLRVAKYSVYVGDNETTLFDAANLLANVDNTTSKTISQHTTTWYTRNLKGRYVGFIFTDPTISKADGTAYTNNKDNVYLRLSEIAVFGRRNLTARGTFAADNVVEIKTPDTANNEVNIVSGKSLTFKGTSDFSTYTTKELNKTVLKKVTDGAFHDGETPPHAELGEYRFYIEENGVKYNMADLMGNAAIFNLEGKFKLNSLYMIATSSNSERISHYAVYAGNNLDKLFEDANFVAEFKNQNASQRTILTFEENVTAKYVGILFLNPWGQDSGINSSQNQVYPRIKEIAVYGVEQPASAAFTNTANDMNTTATTNTSLGDKNAIKDLKAAITYYKNSGETSTATRGNGPAKLTDGDYTNNWMANYAYFATHNSSTNTSKYIGSGIEIGEYYLDIAYTLKTTYDITGFEIFNNVEKAFRTNKYQVYLSDKESTLFDKASLIADFTNTNGDFRNEFKKTEADENYKGKYFGIRVLDPTFDKGTEALANDADGKNNIFPRLSEITLYGTQLAFSGAEEVHDNIVEVPEYEEDYIASSAAITTNHYSNVSGIQGDLDAGTNNFLSDNNIYDSNGKPEEARWGSCKFAYQEGGNKYYIGSGINEGDVYFDIIYDFGNISEISAIALIHCNDPNLRTHKYNIYIGNDSATLFDTPYKEFTNTENNQRNVFNVKAKNGGTPVNARYVAFRIYDPTYSKTSDAAATPTNIYLRLYEIAIFGKVISVTGNASIINDNENKMPNWGRNLATVADIRAYASVNGVYSTTVYNKGYTLTDEVLDTTDCEFNSVKFATYDQYTGVKDNTSKNTGIKGNTYVDIVLNLQSEAYIEGLALFNANIDILRTGDLEIYASKTYSELFEGQPIVKQINDSGYGRLAYDFTGLSEDSSYTAITEEVYAQYIGIRVLNPVQKVNEPGTFTEVTSTKNNIHVRLREIAVFGQFTDPDFVYVPPYTPVNMVLSKEELAAEGHSLINNVLYSQSLQNGASWYHGKIKNPYKKESITDGDPSTKADYQVDFSWSKDTENALDLIWDLNDLYSIEKLLMLGEPNANGTAYFIGWYKIFASDDLDLLFDPSNMVFEYNAIRTEDPNPPSLGQIVKPSTPKNARYVALRVIYPVTTADQYIYARIAEFAVYGSEAELDRTPTNLASSMPVEAYLTDNKGNREEVSDSNLTVKEVSNITDGEASTTATIKTGGDDLSVIVNLCQDVDISEIKVVSANDPAKYINKYKLYASNDYNKLWDSSSLVYTYNGKGNPKQTTSKKFSKAKNMRYVRLEVLDDVDSVTIADIQVIGEKHEQNKNKNFARNNADFELYTMKLDGTGYKVISSSTNEMHDGTTKTTAAITGGIQGESTSNIELNLKDYRNINKLEIVFPRNSEHYSPTLTHVYIGDTEAEVRGEGVKPDYVYEGLPKDNKITIEFKPTFAQYVRVSFVEGGHSKGIFKEMVYAISEMYVYGTSVEGMNPTSSNVLQFEDKKLGIKWGVVRKCTNDVYTEVVDSTVTVSKVTNWQKRSLEKTPYLKVIDDKRYTFKFYDAMGNEVTDFGNRQLDFTFTMKGDMSDSTAMVGYAGNKWYIQPYDSAVNELGWITAKEMDGTDYTYARLCITSSTDPYWDSIGPLEDYGDEPQEFAPSTSIDESLSTAAIITEDNNFSIKPRGTLRLSKQCQLIVEVTTGTIPDNVYDAVGTIDDPNYIAATYTMQLVEDGYTYEFDGKVKTMIHIPEEIKGYFSGYKLVKVGLDGSAEYLDFEKKGDYIYFDTNEVCDFALVGSNYHSDGSAIDSDEYYFDEYGNPITGEANTSALFLNIAILALALIVLVNTRKFEANR